MPKTLCIGGPLDGQIVEKHQPYFETVGSGRENVSYTLRSLSCDGEPTIYFFTADGINEYAAIVRVFTAYSKGKR